MPPAVGWLTPIASAKRTEDIPLSDCRMSHKPVTRLEVAASSMQRRPRRHSGDCRVASAPPDDPGGQARYSKGVFRKWGEEDGSDMTGRIVAGWGSEGMGLAVGRNGTNGPARGVDVMEIARPGALGDIASLGLTLAEAKQLLARVQQAVVAGQVHDHSPSRPVCSFLRRWVSHPGLATHQVATLFGTVAARLPRFRCVGCGHSETAISWPSYCR